MKVLFYITPSMLVSANVVICMGFALCPFNGQINLIAQASSVGDKKHSISTDYVLKVLGLDICSETVVGNDMLRGISGGQRKRVTTGPIFLFRCN